MNNLESIVLGNKDWTGFAVTWGALVIDMPDSVSTHKLTNELADVGFNTHNNANRVFVKFDTQDSAREAYLSLYKLNNDDCYNRRKK